jgi:hypothetical protein
MALNVESVNISKPTFSYIVFQRHIPCFLANTVTTEWVHRYDQSLQPHQRNKYTWAQREPNSAVDFGSYVCRSGNFW